jgi:aryl-alcohol dehydrogenase-like predicted oxidoreductase
MWLGEWMAKRGNRDEIVLATKFTTGYKDSWEDHPIHVNHAGNSAKSLHISVKDSLKKLQTDYIDLLYVHWWYVLHCTFVTLGIIPPQLRNWPTHSTPS